MGFHLTKRAFRFTVGSTRLAIDILNDGVVYDAGAAVHLFVDKDAEGWTRYHAEMEPVFYITSAAIEQAGGMCAFCEMIIEKLNRALRLIFAAPGIQDLTPSSQPHQQVMDFLRTQLEVTYDGDMPVLKLK